MWILYVKILAVIICNITGKSSTVISCKLWRFRFLLCCNKFRFEYWPVLKSKGFSSATELDKNLRLTKINKKHHHQDWQTSNITPQGLLSTDEKYKFTICAPKTYMSQKSYEHINTIHMFEHRSHLHSSNLNEPPTLLTLPDSLVLLNNIVLKTLKITTD